MGPDGVPERVTAVVTPGDLGGAGHRRLPGTRGITGEAVKLVVKTITGGKVTI